MNLLFEDISDAFIKGKLHLGDIPAGGAAAPAATPWLFTLMTAVFVVLALAFLRSFINILPYMVDNFTRARGSAALESSVRVSRDRNIIALIFILPFCLVLYRFVIYNPAYFILLPNGNLRLLIVSGAFVVYLLLRALLSAALRPRRMRGDDYTLSRRVAYTFFILLCIVMGITIAVMLVFSVNPRITRTFLIVEMSFFYLVMVLRRTQILSGSCSPFKVFLYLCGLEFLPTVLWILSATII